MVGKIERAIRITVSMQEPLPLNHIRYKGLIPCPCESDKATSDEITELIKSNLIIFHGNNNITMLVPRFLLFEV